MNLSPDELRAEIDAVLAEIDEVEAEVMDLFREVGGMDTVSQVAAYKKAQEDAPRMAPFHRPRD